jgi:RecA/RadA recombinase
MSLEALAKALEKQGFVSDERSSPINFIDTGIPQLNFILTGDPFKGLPADTIVEIAGESMAGKTMLFSQLAIGAQQAGGLSALWDHEHSYKQALSEKQGLVAKAPYWLYRSGDTFEQSIEESNKHAAFIRNSGAIPLTTPILHGFDSFAAMIPRSQLYDDKGNEKPLDGYTMNDQSALSRVASNVLKVYKQKCNNHGICAVFLNQLAADMDLNAMSKGPKVKSKGGKSLPFYADIRLFLTGQEIKEKGILVKKVMKILVKKNKVAMPGDNITIDFIFDRVTRTGYFDIMPSYVEFLRSQKVFDQAGSWITFNGEKFQGIAKIVEHYSAMPDGLEQLKTLHKEHIDKGLTVALEKEDVGDPDDA